MDETLRPPLTDAIRTLRIRRTALRLQLAETPRWKWRQRRRLERELRHTIVSLTGALSIVGETPPNRKDAP